MVKILITTIQVNLMPIGLLGAAPFFTAWLFLIRYHFFLNLYTAKPAFGWLWGFFNPCVFLFTTGRRKELIEDF